MAYMDTLGNLHVTMQTGYLQRKPVERQLADIIDQIKQDQTGVVSIAYMDLDGFGIIEKEHGYAVADRLIEVIGKHLAQFVDRENIKLANFYVRDAFMIIWDGLNLDDAFFEAESLRRELSETVFTVTHEGQSHEFALTFSAGVATYPGDAEDHNELIDLAEDASKRAFASGGNRSAFGRAVNMVPKTSHYLPTQLERLRDLKEITDRSEASLLREALSDLLRKYDQRDTRREMGREQGA